MLNYLKKYRVIITTICILLIIPTIYYFYRDNSFVKANYILYTGITDFRIIKEYHDEHQSYIETKISQVDLEKIQKRFIFNDTFDYKGKIKCPFISNKKKYIYYIDYDGYGAYGYKLFWTDTNNKTLMIFEEYGN